MAILGKKKASNKTQAEPNPNSALPVVYDPYDPKLLEVPEKKVSATDPLKRYMQELKNAPLLTAEQEQNLTKKMHEEGDVQAAKLLVTANLKLVVRIAYEYRSMYHNLFDDSMLIAGYPNGGKDTCDGDSGGPLIVEDSARGHKVLAGIVSWGIGCAEKNKYGMYSKVSAALPWIKKILSENELDYKARQYRYR